MEERLKVLCYNAIGYMLETHMESEELTYKELCEEIADYLGSTTSELEELGVLNYQDIISNDDDY